MMRDHHSLPVFFSCSSEYMVYERNDRGKIFLKSTKVEIHQNYLLTLLLQPVLEQLQTFESSIHHSVFLEWFSSSIVCSSWPQTVTTLSGWIWLLLFISCHLPSDQIRGVGCPRSLVSLWPDITSPSKSLPNSVCQKFLSLPSHRSGSNKENTHTRQATERDVYYVKRVSPQQ